MATPSLRPLRTFVVVAALVALSGCHSFLGYKGWPFPEYDHTTFLTPAMRIDTIKQFAAQSNGTDSAEQRKLTDQLAQQIQIESDPLVRRAIIKAAADFRTPMAAQIVQAGLNDGSAEVRIACCHAIGARNDVESVPTLATVLRDDEDTDARLAAAEALGKLKGDAAMAALVVALDDKDPAMQFVGMQSLKSISGKDYGGDVQAWRLLATGGAPPEPAPPSIAERLRKATRF